MYMQTFIIAIFYRNKRHKNAYSHQLRGHRYNMERLSVNLEPVEAFTDWKNPIKNGYFPPIACDNGYDWASRQDHTLFKVTCREITTDKVALSLL